MSPYHCGAVHVAKFICLSALLPLVWPQDHRPVRIPSSKTGQGRLAQSKGRATATTVSSALLGATTAVSATTPKVDYEPFRDEQNVHLVGLRVRGTNRPCLLAQMDGRFVIRSLGQYSPFIENWPEYALVGGRCAHTKSDDALLTLGWDKEGAKFRLALTWEASYQRNPVKKNYEWRSAITKAVFTFRPPYGPPLVAENQSPTPVKGPYVQSFYCRNSINITVTSISDEVDATVQFSAPVRMQAYGVEEIGGFGSAYLCERTRRLASISSLRSENTVRAFVLYFVVMVGVFAGYCAKRHFTPEQKTDYDEFE